MKAVFCCALALLPLTTLGQLGNEDLKTMRIVNDLERESRPSRSSNLGPEIEGDPYYSSYFNNGSVTLYRENKTYPVAGMRYDVYGNSLDIRVNDIIKGLDGNVVQSFEYTDSLTKMPRRFLNGKDFTRDGAPVVGFLEVLCWGKVDVYALTVSNLLRPNYNTAIGSGNPNYQITKKKYLLYSPGTELRNLNKKELEKLWAERAADMKQFQKANKLNPSKERDLMLMVDYFNTL